MMTNQTIEKLRGMKLPAMAAEYIRQSESPSMSALDFEERVGMITDAEWLARENHRINKLTKDANLRFPTACFADIDYRQSRKLDRAYIARLSDFEWVKESKNLILTGCTGTGKTWIACAFGAQACHAGLRVAFYRVGRLINELMIASGSGSIHKLLAKLKKVDILILDDWGMTMLTTLECKFMLEVFEDRYNERSTIISAQLPVAKWHDLFEDSTVADAVLDRIVHNAHRIELYGPSMRPLVNKDRLFGSPGGEMSQDIYPLRDQDNTDIHNDGDFIA
jgi:DNA replication protein DnaC